MKRLDGIYRKPAKQREAGLFMVPYVVLSPLGVARTFKLVEPKQEKK